MNPFLRCSLDTLLRTFNSSIVYNPAIVAVVVAKAGIILPAFSLV